MPRRTPRGSHVPGVPSRPEDPSIRSNGRRPIISPRSSRDSCPRRTARGVRRKGNSPPGTFRRSMVPGGTACVPFEGCNCRSRPIGTSAITSRPRSRSIATSTTRWPSFMAQGNWHDTTPPESRSMKGRRPLRNVRRGWPGKVPESKSQFGLAIPQSKADNSFALNGTSLLALDRFIVITKTIYAGLTANGHGT